MPDPVHNICLDLPDLFRRKEEITRILKPLVSGRNTIYIHHTQRNSSEFVWVAVALRESTQGDYESKKFPITDSFQASYHERWQRNFLGKEEYWYLERAYLHFYKLNKETADYDEYLLLHCDPNEDREHAPYKQCPHHHIEVAPHPWPKAHIALNVGFLKEMLTDASSLTKAFEGAIIMLHDQVLQHLQN